VPTPPYPLQQDCAINVVLDDATIDRLRDAAMARGIELEQLIVQVIHLASRRLDEL
jgi:predicted DNA binding CopG/RHH family protein